MEKVKINDLKAADYNPRVELKPGNRKYEDLKRSIQKFGFVDPVVINFDNTLIGGHQRVNVARDMGIEEIPAYRVNLQNKDDERALNIALNKIMGSWNDEALKTIFEGFKAIDYDMSVTGFSDKEIKKYLDLHIQPEKPAQAFDWAVKLGDKFMIDSKHYVMCGDSLNPTHVKMLLGEVKINQLMTDPPYGVDYGDKSQALQIFKKRGRKHSEGEILNDKGLDYYTFFSEFLKYTPWADYNTVYIFMSGKELANLYKAFIDMGGTWGDYLIWVKQQLIIGRKDYHPKHEFIFYGWHGKHKFYGAVNACALIDFKHPAKNPLHPHQKPVELIAQLINDGSCEADIVYDPFAGSGSVMIAAHVTKRISYNMELDPKNVNIILNRASGQGLEVKRLDMGDVCAPADAGNTGMETT